MNYTQQSPSLPERSKIWQRLLPLGAGTVLWSSCASSAFTHAEYRSLRPRTVAISPVTNATVYPLDRVSFGGPLQRFAFGTEQYDLAHILGVGIEETLRLKGYTTVVLNTRPEFAPGQLGRSKETSGDGDDASGDGDDTSGKTSLPYDGIVFATIDSYTSNSGAIARMNMEFEVILYDAKTGQKLFSNNDAAYYADNPRQRAPHRIPQVIQAAAARALDLLPSAREE